MKTNTSKPHAAAALLTGIILVLAADMVNAQHIDPTTGMPVSDTANVPRLDFTTGLPVSSKAGDPTEAAANIAMTNQATVIEVHELIDQGRYDEALQSCLSVHNQIKADQSFGLLVPLFSDWVELGRRFPKARESLIEIRDHDVHEFSEGRGYSELFLEVNYINSYLNQADATYALFKTIHQQDKQLAAQCYYYVQDLLMQKGEYELCLNYIGNPQVNFDQFNRGLEAIRELQQRRDEMQKEYPMPVPPVPRLPRGAFKPLTPPDVGQMATNNFVGQVCKLVEILVATDHMADAEKIRDEAVAIIDDARLHSAISDAEEKISRNADANVERISK